MGSTASIVEKRRVLAPIAGHSETISGRANLKTISRLERHNTDF